jgi:ParB family chromosome partitioning protein
MARKGVFDRLIETQLSDEASKKLEISPPSRAVEGLRGSLQDLQKSAAQDIPVDQIRESLIRDRIDLNEGIEDLVASFGRDGQEVPIKVRLVPGEMPYEIVVGRRRLAAARALNWKHLRGFVVELDDKAMLRALTTENTGRLDTSFIGKAQLTYLALEHGHRQSDIGEFLGISQSLVSFMLRVYRGLGAVLVDAIGDAPGVGRNRWQTLQKLIEARETPVKDLIASMNDHMGTYGDDVERVWQKANAWGADTEGLMPSSTKRFEVLLRALKETGKAPAPPERSRTAPRIYLNGTAQSVRKGKVITIKATGEEPSGLLDYIESRMAEIIEAYENETP